jgi:hypothetical protein
MRRVAFSLVLLLAASCRPPGYGKGGGGGGGDDDPGVDAPPAQTDGPAATTCEHGFRLEGNPSASSVWVTGNFTSWGGDPDHGALVLALGGDGAWTVTQTFNAGDYQYKFVIDGTNWIPDPGNPNTVDDGFGGINSVYTCAP